VHDRANHESFATRYVRVEARLSRRCSTISAFLWSRYRHCRETRTNGSLVVGLDGREGRLVPSHLRRTGTVAATTTTSRAPSATASQSATTTTTTIHAAAYATSEFPVRGSAATRGSATSSASVGLWRSAPTAKRLCTATASLRYATVSAGLYGESSAASVRPRGPLCWFGQLTVLFCSIPHRIGRLQCYVPSTTASTPWYRGGSGWEPYGW
jgi:hypothetical protein